MKRIWIAFGLFFSLPLLAQDFALETIDSWDQFQKISTPGGGLVQDGAFARFFMDDRDGGGHLYFVDGNYTENGKRPEYVRYHFDFATKMFALPETLDSFDTKTYFTRETKPYFAGLLHRYDVNGRTVLAAQFYPQDVAHDQQIARAIEVISQRVRIPHAARLFLATGEQQATESVAAQLTSYGMPAVSLAELADHSTVLPLEPGEAEGTLRLFPLHPETLTPSDIAVFETAPADLPPVAALITTKPQARVSRLNWRLRERGVPNLRLPNASLLNAYADRPIHLKVTMSGYEITPPTGRLPVALARSVAASEEMRIVPFEALGADAAARFGQRAAARAFLASHHAPIARGLAAGAGWMAQPPLELARALRAQWKGVGAAVIRVSALPGDLGDWRYDDVSVNFAAGEAAVAHAIETAFAQVTGPLAQADRLAMGIEGAGAGLVVEEDFAASREAAVITRIPNVSDVYGYFVSAAGDEGAAPFLYVDKHEPIGWSPLLRLAGEPVHQPEIAQLVEFAQTWELAYCEANPAYYPKKKCAGVYSDPHKDHTLAIAVARTAGGLHIRDWHEFPGK